jgi:hypothetical protein
MKKSLYALMALMAGLAAFAFAGTPASAATAGATTITIQDILSGEAFANPLFTQAQFRGRCDRINRRCRARFGFGPLYQRCMARADCRFTRRRVDCRRVERRCRSNFGRGPRYFSCVRRAGCR